MSVRTWIAMLLLLLVSAAALAANRLLHIELPFNFASLGKDGIGQSEPAAPAKPANEGSKTDLAATHDPASALAEIGKGLGTTGQDATNDGQDNPPSATTEARLDVARIAKDGTSVFAGQAKPDSYVTLQDGDTVVGTAKADGNGEWTFVTDHKFASADPKLTLRMSNEAPRVAAIAPEPEQPKKPDASPPEKTAAEDALQKFEALVADARKEAAAEASNGDAAASPTPEPTPSQPSASSTASTSSETVETTVEPSQQHTQVTTAGKGAEASVSIPVPITFFYNEAALTPEGDRAAKLLLEYVKLKRLSTISLSGHADERGSDAFNFELSRERLDTVASLLRDGGYVGELELVPKGKSEPYLGVDRTKFSGETLYQLDRRVELRFTR